MTTEKDDSKGPEAAIRNAIDRGDFDNLKGKGKPLDLNDYYDTPEDVRIGFSLLKNAGYVPEEIEFLKLITEIKVRIKFTNNENERKELSKKLLNIQLKYDMRMERFNKRLRILYFDKWSFPCYTDIHSLRTLLPQGSFL